MTDENKKIKPSAWKIAAIILGVLLAISIFTNGFNFKKSSSIGATLTAQEAADKAVKYINNYLLQPGTSASLTSVKDDGSIYNAQINIEGRTFDSYITKDGKLLFPDAIDLDDTSIAPPTPTSTNTAPSAPSTDMDTLIDDDTVKGDLNAPVTIVEWSDFECPFCTRFFEQALPSIQKEYIDTGKVKFVYRDFPLNFHANAQKSAEAAECAGEQGKFWEMHDKLFEEGVSGGVSSFKQYAADIGLDTVEFNNCLDSGKMADEVRKDFQDGQVVGIQGTPGFVINGQLVSGAQPFENFKQIIEAELVK